MCYVCKDDNYYPIVSITNPIYVNDGLCMVAVQFRTTRLNRNTYDIIKYDSNEILSKNQSNIEAINRTRCKVYVRWKPFYTDLNNIQPCFMLKQFIIKYKLRKYYTNYRSLTDI